MTLKSSKEQDAGRRKQLMDIAVQLFAQKGYPNTKISDIVAAAGVAQGTFYWYFKSKQEIVIQLVADGHARLLQVIGQGYRKQSGTVDDMVKSSTKLMKDLLEFAESNRHLMALMFIEGSGGDEAIRSAISETRIAIEQAFRRNIERAVELKMLPDHIDFALRSSILTSLVEGTISRWLFGAGHDMSHKPALPADVVAAELARFEFFGLLGS
ncbi:TetR/AcrR family transcriptional regulator [Paenibacillus sp. GCM10027626]|uniref:TetR/AcrR family transcriptional regulator n=1 Tax=Paenibacillus sp. GCM10027626 TaxID=3273411 RepID=UPI003632D0AF